ncbi:uncharacterized protein LOC116127210 [Pistacia vera]|uniref:uncharacterized protein LOC116127210 n=1 Tax=Pistacia vera TaxID=55513 RepID=UPI001263226F|nr:uncharacterized protein LOC116127210 [Pistacia vera]
MPSVGMRRTTRVFGVVKGADGARVLRSGRRLWPEFGDWYQQPLVKKSSGNGPGGLKCKPNGWTHVEKIKLKHEEEREDEETDVTEIIKNEKETKVCKKVKEEEEKEAKVMDKMFGIVYRRKRKRLGGRSSELSGDKMYGIRFRRRQRRRKCEESGVGSERLAELVREDEEVGGFRVFGIGLESSCIGRSSWFARFVSLVLRYMVKARLEMPELASFLLSQPINEALSTYGIRFLWDPPIGVAGMFKLFGVMQVMPSFSLDFSAVPSCFMYIHCSMLIRLKRLPPVLVNNLVSLDSNDEIMSSIRSYQTYESSDEDVDHVCDTKTMMPVVDSTVNRVALHPSVRASKLTGRNVQHRNALNSRTIQKRRSSLRRRRARNPSLGGAHKGSGTLVSDLVSSRKNGIPFSSVVSKNKLRSSIRSSPASRFKEVNCNKDQTRQDLVPSCCSASILVIESDRCYRVEGASVMLEVSSSREWLLVVKKDGVTRYTHRAQKMMRPCSSNRVTHDIIWTGDDNWKLEFPNRQDWLIFKDLYKECSDRNVHASVAKVIPVPGVWVVSGYEECITVPFCRPESYISINNDEVSRALTRRTANYDMDSEDVEWLKKFNNEFFTENELQNHVSEDNFELMVDVFEKAYFCSPDDYSNEEAAVNLCLDLGRREVVQAVYSYWVKKRKQKRSGLLRVFQGQQVKKPALIPKPALRKRRSFKRQASQLGRGKQPVLMQAIVEQQDAMEEQNAMLRVEEAKASAKRYVESAVGKRQRAQLLMDVADLATYKAAIALRIAEAAEVAESAEAAAAHFLDGEA